jgi:transcriptional regulator GlxA family with amidase domain
MDARIQRVTIFLEHNIHQRVSLTTMAQVAGLSPSRFRHKFKAEIGVTPTIYLLATRLKLARALLRDDSLSVKEVRAAIGIQSDSYFTRQFKNTYGHTPSRSRSIDSSRSSTEAIGTGYSQIEQRIAS